MRALTSRVAAVRRADGLEYSLYLSFFRIRKHVDAQTGRISWAHAVHWAVIDPSGERYVTQSLVDPDAPAMMRESLKKRQRDKTGVTDPMLLQAIHEVLDKGTIPLPDRMMDKHPSVSERALDIDFGSGHVRRTETGSYEVHAWLPDGSTGFALLFTPSKPAIRHGRNGVVKGHDGDDMFYYFIPRCSVRGNLVVDGRRVMIMRGDGWYDHEFGGKPSMSDEDSETEDASSRGRNVSSGDEGAASGEFDGEGDGNSLKGRNLSSRSTSRDSDGHGAAPAKTSAATAAGASDEAHCVSQGECLSALPALGTCWGTLLYADAAPAPPEQARARSSSAVAA